MNYDKILPAVYESQRDNHIDPHYTCAVTCLSMLIQSAGMKKNETRKAKHLEDEILIDLKTRYPKSHEALREDFLFLREYAEKFYKLKLKYQKLNRDEWVGKILSTTKIFMSSTSNALTRSGHIIVVRGARVSDDMQSVYVNDPYGKWPYAERNGEGVLYPLVMFPREKLSGAIVNYHTLGF